jgi:hypothetical protein
LDFGKIERTKQTKDNTKMAKKQNTKESEDTDVIVANVPKRFTLSIGYKQNEQFTYLPGNWEMPRSHAQHFYSVANGVVIIGSPNIDAINNPEAQFAVREVVSKLTDCGNKADRFGKIYSGLPEEKQQDIKKAVAAIEVAVVMLEGLLNK